MSIIHLWVFNYYSTERGGALLYYTAVLVEIRVSGNQKKEQTNRYLFLP